ncbi:DUF2946 domain-containing protein [Paraburkholderia xenovorans]|uniref:DUF2946 domain-containing protein n=1 Tax=Paraburkholderia xenovorans TaxID=36873 RepID=UPI0038BBE351
MSRLQQKIGSWLGLLAILMATLAPTISHTLAARRGESGMQGEHCSMPSMSGMMSMDDMPAVASMQSMHLLQPPAANPASFGSDHKHASLSDGDACGYCSLLAHMPVVPSVEALFFITVRAIQQRVAVRFESVRRVEPLTFAQPRAPPFSA